MAFISNRTGKPMGSLNDKPVEEEKTKKKKDRKATLIAILIMAVLFVVIWFGLEFLATEHPISHTPITIAGKERVLKFSEKTRGYTNKDQTTGIRESGTSHYGYFLELVDSVAKKSLHKLKFKAPVHNIQNTPQMYIASNGNIWLVSTSNGFNRDEEGFILKFIISNDSIKQLDYILDELYGIRDIKDNKVMLAKGSEFYQAYNEFFGGIYLDLETGKIIDNRKK
ncbi:MAG: hypothetical protein JNJ40_13860 [Bacteroidia bacterium]|nr:hypothetical protein [Bacteroidia bacterium]